MEFRVEIQANIIHPLTQFSICVKLWGNCPEGHLSGFEREPSKQ